MPRRVLLALALILPVAGPARAADEPTYRDRWVYVGTNLQVEKNATDLVRLIERAGKAGYTGLVLADYKLNILDRVPDHYFKHLARVKKAAQEAGIEIIPAVFPIGYSSGLLAHDVNLAEGIEVRHAPFVVRDGTATLVRDAAPLLKNGALEEARNGRFTGWTFQDDPGKTTFVDRETVHGGKASCRMGNFAGRESPNCRLMQRVRLRPHACYRLSAWVKTQNLEPAGAFKLLALGAKGRTLSFHEGELPGTTDWKQISIVFNTLDETEVNLYAGIWGPRGGTLWIDDVELQQLGLVNVLRRPGCPLVVESSDGSTTYEEGKDFEPVRDSKLGMTPYAGEYTFDHAGPAIRLKPGSRIKDGESLRVSWYHPILTHSYQVMCCLTEPAVYAVLERQARLVQKHLAPRTWFMSHDEIRFAGWCRACQEGKQAPGKLLADNARRCVGILRKLDPKARIVVWSDMFDPHHNAVDRYYLVNGSLRGSWEGLPRDVEIANWNRGQAEKSLGWFAGRGHGQIVAGFYDSGPENFRHWDRAARGVAGVTGFMYTTWQRDYRHLEEFARLMQRRPK
ncbi:MAG: hypothetical protein U0840_29000 [Gemmataceae bacterium]